LKKLQTPKQGDGKVINETTIFTVDKWSGFPAATHIIYSKLQLSDDKVLLINNNVFTIVEY
jgi:hypothetical protein